MSTNPKKSDEKKYDEDKSKKKKYLDEETSEIAINTLLNQALSYAIDTGMVEMEDEMRTLNVLNRHKVVEKADEVKLDDDDFKELGKISSKLKSEIK